ncbi:unnamed protein product, partial [Rotaria socialis]
MLHSYLNRKDQRTSSNHQKNTYAAWSYFIAIGFITCVLVSIAVLVIISLIPLYLPDPPVNTVYDSTKSDVIGTEYATSYELPITDLSYIPITNIQELGSEITTALKVKKNTISVITALMNTTSATQSSNRRRRLASCEAETASGGAKVQIRLLITYPRQCGHSSACKANFLDTIRHLLETMTVFSPILECQHGIGRISVPLQICRVEVEKKKTTTTTTTTTTRKTTTTTTT